MPTKKSSAQAGTKPKPKGPPPVIKYYLIAYNLFSFFLWSVVLITLGKHMIMGPQTSSALLHKVSTLLEPFRPHRKYLIKAYKNLPAPLANLLVRSSTAHSHIGGLVAFTQTFAVLEIVHAALGWVRSPVATTAIQVGSRLWSVWGVTEAFDSAATSPAYAGMIFAWSATEVIRYNFYANQLLGNVPYLLLWARYTTFYVLYPLGAGTEAACMFATLPNSLPWNSKTGVWGPREYLFLSLFALWWPGLYTMYTYMIKQRKRAIGKGFWGHGGVADEAKKAK